MQSDVGGVRGQLGLGRERKGGRGPEDRAVFLFIGRRPNSAPGNDASNQEIAWH